MEEQGINANKNGQMRTDGGDISKKTNERHRETDRDTEASSVDRGTECAIEMDGTERLKTSREMNSRHQEG